jgi:hypothetical protein
LLGRQVDPTAEIHQLSDVYELYKEGGRERYPTTELVVKAIAGSTSHVDDLEVHQPEGQVIPLELWSTPVFAPDSSVRFGIVAFADVSDRKRAEWASSGLTDIHHQGRRPREDVQNGDHGEEEAALPPVVHSGVQG